MAVAYVSGQKAANGASGAGTTVAVAYPGNVTSGNLLVCTTRCGDLGSQAISDNLGDAVSWTEAAGATADGDSGLTRGKTFYKIAGASAACTVTLTIGTSGVRRGLAIREFSGSDASPLDDTAGNTGADTSMECGSVTMTANGVIVTGWTHSSTQTTTIDTDYTESVENTTGRCGNAHRITSAITDEAIHTASANSNWAGFTATFKEAGAAGRTTKNTREFTHGVNVGMGFRMNL